MLLSHKQAYIAYMSSLLLTTFISFAFFAPLSLLLYMQTLNFLVGETT